MRKIIKTVLLIAWCVLIYYLSSQSGSASGGLSTRILRYIGTFINNFKSIDIDIFVRSFGVLIRKSAYFSEYFILYILAKTCFKEYGLKNILIVLIFCVIYASFDEFHQLFVDGRSGQIRDVLIDSLGSLFSLFVCRLINKND